MVGQLTVKSDRAKRVNLHSSHIVQEASALIGLFLILCLYRSSALRSFDSHFIGGSEYDAGLYLWIVKTNLENFRLWVNHFTSNFINLILVEPEDPLSVPLWFDTRALFPYGSTLGFSDNFIVPSLVVGLLKGCGLSFVAAWNSLMLTATLLNGYFSYRLCMRVGGVYLPAILSGAAFMTWSWFGEHLGHPQLQFAFFIPLSFLLFVSYLDKPRLKSSFYLGIIILLTFLSCIYYSIFITLMLAISFVAAATVSPKFRNLKFIFPLIIGLILVGPLFYPFAIPYINVQGAFGERHLYEPFFFSATGLSYFSAPVYNWLYGQISSDLSHAEAHLFPGLLLSVAFIAFLCHSSGEVLEKKITIALISALVILGALAHTVNQGTSIAGVITKTDTLCIIAGVISWLLTACSAAWFYLKRKNYDGSLNLGALFVLLLVFFFVISLGPLGNDAQKEPTLGLYTFFYHYFPGFSAARAIGRAGILVAFCLSMLLGLLFSASSKLDYRIATVKLASLLLILAENFNFVYPLEREPRRPAIFKEVDQIAKSDHVLMVLPYALALGKADYQISNWPQFARLSVNYMNWSLPSQSKIINGYSGQQTWFMRQLPRKLTSFPDERSLTLLRHIANLKYIIVLSKYIPNFNQDEFKRKLTSLSDDLEVLARDSEGNFLLALKGSNQIADQTSIITPPDHGKKNKLSFYVRSNILDDVPSSSLKITDAESKELIGTVRVFHDGSPQKIDLWPTATGNSVKPRRFKVELETTEASLKAKAKLFLRNPEFTVY